VRELQAVASIRGFELHILHAGTESELDAVFETLPRLRAGALVIRQRCLFQQPPPAARGIGGALRRAHDVPISRVRRGRRLGQLRREPCRRLPHTRRLCWPDSQGRQAGRPAGSSSPRRSSCSST
jgi:hypothetical protein